jgi:hypothetical protein
MAYSLKQKLINDIQDLPEKKIKEVFDFVEYLKLKEDKWFIRYVNQRGQEAGEDRKAGKRFISLAELQKEYR